MAVLEEQQRRIKEAMSSKPALPADNLEMKAVKVMGAMEEGDAVFGSGAEVNLDSQVLPIDQCLIFICYVLMGGKNLIVLCSYYAGVLVA